MNFKFILCLVLVLGGGLAHNSKGGGSSPVKLESGEYSSISNSMEWLTAFKASDDFSRQFEVAEKIVALHDTMTLQGLADSLTNEDRHVRANTAFVFASLGDRRGFEVLCQILRDRSPRPEGQGGPGGNWTLQAQIASDRYYAVWIFGALKDRRAVPILIPLLADKEVNYIVPWALGQTGDKRAIQPLIETLNDPAPSIRVLAMYALERLKAREALPRLQALLNDNDQTDFGDLVTVADAADEAIIELRPPRDAIDRLDADLTSSSGLWLNGFPSGIVSLPDSTDTPEVVSDIISQANFRPDRVTNYRIIESRRVNIPEGSIPKHYTMVLVKTNLGEKIVVMRYSSEGKGWWHRIYDANGPPYIGYY